MKLRTLLATLCLPFLCIAISSPMLAQQTNTYPDQHFYHDHDHERCASDIKIRQRAAADPNYAREIAEFKQAIPTLSRMEANNDRSVAPIITIPVVVHVIHNGETIGTGANLSDERIQAQIDVLNEDFSATNANFGSTPAPWNAVAGNPEIQFCLAVIDPDGNATTGITRDNIAVTGTDLDDDNIESDIKPATWWDSDLYYNIYTLAIPGTTAGGGTTGYAFYPTGGAVGNSIDGSVVDYRWFGGPGFGQSGYKTLTHETGHYLGLPHTFDDENCAADDGIADTPNIEAPTSSLNPSLNCGSGFPTGPTSCTNEHMYVNYMDYVNDSRCYTSFSAGQIAVMRSVLNGTAGSLGFASRLPLANSSVSVCSFFDNDAGVAAINAPGSNQCGSGMITPEVVLRNFGTATLSTVTITYQINADTPVDFLWVDNLGTGETATVSLAPYSPPAGIYTFKAYTQMPNGVTDEQLTNDTITLSPNTIVPENPPLQENFEDAQWDPTTNGVYQVNYDNDGSVWTRSTAASGFGMGTASAMFDNFNGINGTSDGLLTKVYDFTAVTTSTLTFDVAYARFSNTFFDSLYVYASTDCGITYDQVLYANGNTGLATRADFGGTFTPSSTEWRTESIDLSAFAGFSSVSLAFVNKSGFGNRLFIDNINIQGACDITIESVNSSVNCFGDCNGTASVNILTGTGPFTYQWDANALNQTTATATNLCAGTYSVTVTESGGCTAVAAATITAALDISLTASGTNETAVDANDGTATASGAGGTGTLNYLWTGGLSGAAITNLSPGDYIVTATDDNGCTATATVTVEEYACPTIEADTDQTDVTCFGGSDGTAIVVVSGGTGPFTYLWSNDSTNASVSGLIADTYTVTITDAGNCTAQATIVINEPTALSVDVAVTNVSCNGANDGFATATVSGGVEPYTYAWSTGMMTIGTISGLMPGNHDVTITDGNTCSTIQTFSISEPEALTISVSGMNETSAGANDGLANANIISGGSGSPYTYIWTNSMVTATITNLPEGTYCVTVTDDGNCTASACIDLNPGACDLEVSLTESHINCNNQNDGTATANPTGGLEPYTYLWSNGGIMQTTTNLSSGTVFVTISDAAGCMTTGSTEILNPDLLVVSVSTTDESMAGAEDGTATANASGGSGAYTYQWDNSENGVMIANLADGLYCVTVTDTNGCTAESCAGVDPGTCSFSVPLSIENIECADQNTGSISVEPSGGIEPYTYIWNTGVMTASLNNQGTGLYLVTVTDAAGCSEITEGNITASPALNLIVNVVDETSAGANDGMATADVSGGSAGGYTFLWNTLATTATITGLAPATYCVTVTDELGCSIENCATIGAVICDVSTGFTSSDVTCFGANDGAASLDPTGGVEPYTYSWNTGASTINVDNLSSGAYSVTVIDAEGCEAIETFVVSEPAPLLVTVSHVNETTLGAEDGSAAVNAAGGSGSNYTFAWNTGAVSQVIDNLEIGTYCVTVTDETGCTASACTAINASNCEVAGNLSITNITCGNTDNGTAELIPTVGVEPFTFSWSNSESGPTIDDLTTGIYAVTMTDAMGCRYIQNFTIALPPAMTSTNVSVIGASDGSASAEPIGGGAGYTYLWNTGATTAIISDLTTGVYCVTVTDNTGCTAEGCTQVNVGVCDIELDVLTTAGTCNGLGDGTATAIPSGGMEPYTYSWSIGGSSMATITDMVGGAYAVTVVDAMGCEAVQVFIVEEPAALELMISNTPAIPGPMDGSATAVVEGGTPDYTYLWTTSETTESIENLSAGIYCVTVTDANNCTVVGCTTIDESCGLTIMDISTEPAGCFGENNGSIELIISGGSFPIDYAWSNDTNTAFPSINGLVGGIYSVTITDANDCQLIETGIVIEEGEEIIINSDVTNASAIGVFDGAIDLTVSGGAMPYTYQWNTGPMDPDLDNLEAGLYGVTVTDAEGCSESTIITVGIGNDPCADFVLNVQTDSVSCNGGADGTISLGTNGGLFPITYAWEGGEDTSNLMNLEAGEYIVTVTDADECEIIQTIIVNEPAAIDLTISHTNETDVDANNGTAIASVLGGMGEYEYDWSNGDSVLFISDLAPAIYYLTVTDENGCSITDSVTILEFVDLCADFVAEVSSAPVTCNGDNDGSAMVDFQTGLAPYTYTWSSGIPNNSMVSGLSAGNHQVTIEDANDCQTVINFMVESPNALLAQTTSFDGTCGSGGSGSVVISGGNAPYDILWSTGSMENFVIDLATGTYGVTVVDVNGCVTTSSVTVSNEASGIDADVDSDNVTCFGDTDGFVNLTITSGQAPFDFQWSNGATTEDLEDVPAGSYTLFLTDSDGCTFLINVPVNEPGELQINFDWTTPTSGNNGSASAMIFGGTTPYTYQWNTGANSPTISGLALGTYQVTVTDGNGCSVVDEINIGMTTTVSGIESLQQLDVYPNPTEGDLSINAIFGEQEQVNIALYNVIGQVAYESQYTGTELQTTLSLDNQAAGTYFLRLSTNRGSVVRKVVLLR